MPLRRAACLTPESLTARRANALKSPGPRTPRGKARISFNALKHGQYAARSARLRERLIRAGYERQEELYGLIRSKIAQTFGTPDHNSRQHADRLTNLVWCLATRYEASRPYGSQANSPQDQGPFATGTAQIPGIPQEASMGTKLESLTKERDSPFQVPPGQWERSTVGKPSVVSGSLDGQPGAGDCPGETDWPERLRRVEHPGSSSGRGCHLGGEPMVVRFKHGVRDDWRRIGLTFWVQRKAYCTLQRVVRILEGKEAPAPPKWNQGLERAVRSPAFRLRKPNPPERWRVSRDADGQPDRTREPWKSARARAGARDSAWTREGQRH